MFGVGLELESANLAMEYHSSKERVGCSAGKGEKVRQIEC